MYDTPMYRVREYIRKYNTINETNSFEFSG